MKRSVLPVRRRGPRAHRGPSERSRALLFGTIVEIFSRKINLFSNNKAAPVSRTHIPFKIRLFSPYCLFASRRALRPAPSRSTPPAPPYQGPLTGGPLTLYST